MLPSLPDRVDPWRLAELGKELGGSVRLLELPRLAPSLVEGGEAVYRLRFGVDAEGRAMVDGWVGAELPVQCQRCLGTRRVPVDSRFELAFVRGLDEANALPDRYEPALCEEGWLRPVDLVEDELILSLPAVPLHDEGDCVPPTDAERIADAAEQDGPFAILASLRKKDDAAKH